VAQYSYFLIIAGTCFVLSSWPSSGSSNVFRNVQLLCQIMWQRFYIFY